MMILVDDKAMRSRVKTSAWRFRISTGLNLKLTAQTSTYLLYELRRDEGEANET